MYMYFSKADISNLTIIPSLFFLSLPRGTCSQTCGYEKAQGSEIISLGFKP